MSRLRIIQRLPLKIKLQKLLCTLLLAVGIPFSLVALDSSKAHLSFEPFFSYQYGKLGEYLYCQESSNSDFEKLSYLEWEEKPLWLYGLKMNASYKHLYLGVSATSAIPASCGKMYDSDWMDRNNLGLKTNFSESNNFLHSYIDVSGTFGFIVFPESVFRIMPFGEVGFYNVVFKAKGAECWYGDADSTRLGYDVSWNSPYAEHFVISKSETVIEYNHSSFYTFLGCQFMLVPTERLEFDVALAVSPYSYIYSVDHHIMRSLKFRDESDSYFKTFKGRLSAYYTINDIITAGLSFGGIYTKMDLSHSYSYVSSNSGKYNWLSNEKGTSDTQSFNVTASLRINVF